MVNDEQKKPQKIIIGGMVNNQELEEFYKNSENDNQKFDVHLIAYLDFLGFEEKMTQEKSRYSLKILKYLLRGARSVANSISHTNDINEFQIKIFSDNIVISQKVEQEILSNQITSLVNLVGSIQFHALMYFGFLIRGGITIGELSIDSTIVWGTGLIDAYNIENNLANYPRIIISQKLLKEYELCKQKEINLYDFIKEDFDGLWFINFLLAAPNIELIPKKHEILKDFIESHIDKSEKIKQKVNWLATYFNKYCYELRDRVDYEKYTLSYI